MLSTGLLCSDDRLIYLNSVITVIPSTGVAVADMNIR